MASQSLRIRSLGYTPGLMPTGHLNSILDVPGVHVAQMVRHFTNNAYFQTATWLFGAIPTYLQSRDQWRVYHHGSSRLDNLEIGSIVHNN